MKAVILCEHIGKRSEEYVKLQCGIIDSALPGMARMFSGSSSKPWVAEIQGACEKFGYKRKFLKGKIDLAKSSGNGNRGVFYRFILSSGRIYEVSRRTSWRGSERFFCTVEGFEIKRKSKSEVDEWLKLEKG